MDTCTANPTCAPDGSRRFVHWMPLAFKTIPALSDHATVCPQCPVLLNRMYSAPEAVCERVVCHSAMQIQLHRSKPWRIHVGTHQQEKCVVRHVRTTAGLSCRTAHTVTKVHIQREWGTAVDRML